jgi:hypothetical protein
LVSLDSFDICFLNDIAVANSGLVHQYSLVDPRVRELMMTVKQWAKEFQINSAKDNFISSYAWMNLVIFYLQCIGFLPNLQSPSLMEAVGLIPDPQKNYWHSVNSLDTCTLTWDALKHQQAWNMPQEFEEVSIPALLYGFYEFYGFRFPWTFAVSIKQGSIRLPKLSTRKVCCFFSIEDPFETYDSHCPHDLGTPTNESGSDFLITYLRDAESHLFDIISKGDVDEQKLWPDPPIFEPEPLNCTGNKQIWKRFEDPVKISDHDKGNNTGKELNVEKNEGLGNDTTLKQNEESNQSEDRGNNPNLNPGPNRPNGRKGGQSGSTRGNGKARTKKPNETTRRKKPGRGQRFEVPARKSDHGKGNNIPEKPNFEKNEGLGTHQNVNPNKESNQSKGIGSNPNLSPNEKPNQLEGLSNDPSLKQNEKPNQHKGRKGGQSECHPNQGNEKPRPINSNEETRRRRPGRGQRFDDPARKTDHGKGSNNGEMPDIEKNEGLGNHPNLNPNIESNESEGLGKHPSLDPKEEPNQSGGLKNQASLNLKEGPKQPNGRKGGQRGNPRNQGNEKPKPNKSNEATQRRRPGRGQQSANRRNDQSQQQQPNLDRRSDSQNHTPDEGTKSDRPQKESIGNPPSRNHYRGRGGRGRKGGRGELNRAGAKADNG